MLNLSKEKRYALIDNYSYFIDHKKEAEEYFQMEWKSISESASILWTSVDDVKHWTEEEIKNLSEKYFYYIDHKDEAEIHFKTIWNSIEYKISKLGLAYAKHNWKKEEIKDLKDNYSYYVNHIDEAKVHFRRRWSMINKKALNLGLIYSDWTEEQLNKLKENYFYYLDNKEEAEIYFRKVWESIRVKASELKITSMKINKKCAQFLGVHVAERVLSHVFKDVERMPIHNPGFDFICNKGYKIDSKASCLNKNDVYTFVIKKNKTADYFLCIGFDNRENLNPQHIWLIKGDEMLWDNKMLNEHASLVIPNTIKGLSKFSKYELTDKLKETIECCTKLKLDTKDETI